jgi:hypothetical protein
MSGRILASSGRVGGAGIWALLILLVLIALLLAVTALQRPESDESAPPFALDSASPTGLLALVRWLEALDYRVERMDAQQSMQMPAGTVLFRYPQPSSYSTDDAAALKNWVAAGGTLVLVGPAVEEAALADAFGVRMTPGALLTDMRRQVQPLLPEGSASYWPSLQFDAQVLDLSGAPAAVAVLADDYGQPVLAVQKIGAGTVWHIVPGIAFSNDGLRQNRQGELLPALLRTAPPGSTVVFDTSRLFDFGAGQPIATLQDWLYRTPGGWATLLGVVAGAAFLLLQGRRLGPPLVTTAERPRREAAEHVRALAALARRSQLTPELVEYQRRRLKRGLAQRLPVSADLPDAEFVDRMRRATPALAPETLAQVQDILAELQPTLDERRLVTLAAQIDDILRQMGVQAIGVWQ